MSLRMALFSALALLPAVPALAQTPPASPAPTRLRGTIAAMNTGSMTVQPADGMPAVAVELPANLAVGAVAARKLSDIKPNDFVGTTAVPGPGGRLVASEVHIFPEAMRGTGEGHYPWDRGASSTMTNAAVSGIAEVKGGQTLTLAYKDGKSEIEVPAAAAIVAFVPGDASLLKVGAAVFVVATPKPDGTWTAQRIVAEKDGVKPPM